MYINQAPATLVDLSMNDNTAGDEGPDMYNNAATILCSTSCIAGQYSEQCDIAMTNDNLQCSINCKVGWENYFIYNQKSPSQRIVKFTNVKCQSNSLERNQLNTTSVPPGMCVMPCWHFIDDCRRVRLLVLGVLHRLHLLATGLHRLCWMHSWPFCD